MPEPILIEGIVIRRQDLGEADRRVTILTSSKGRLDVIAKGARRSSSRLSASTEPFTISRMSLALGKKNKYLTQSQILQSYPKIREDYDKLSVAFALGELFASFTMPEQETQALYPLFLRSLSFIVESKKPVVTLLWSGLKLLASDGQLPSFVQCVLTGKELEEDPAYFSFRSGGYIHSSERSKCSGGQYTSAKILVTLYKLSLLEAPPKNLKDPEGCFALMRSIWSQASEAPLLAMNNIVYMFDDRVT